MVKWPNCHVCTAGPEYPSTRRWSESPSRAATVQGRRRYASCALPIPPTCTEGWCLSFFLRICLCMVLSLCLSVYPCIHLSVSLSLYAKWPFNSHSAFLLYFMQCVHQGIQGHSPSASNCWHTHRVYKLNAVFLPYMPLDNQSTCDRPNTYWDFLLFTSLQWSLAGAAL